MTLIPITLLGADSATFSVLRELELYIKRLEAYESGDSDGAPYVPAQSLIRASEQITKLHSRLAINDAHLANLINARRSDD